MRLACLAVLALFFAPTPARADCATNPAAAQIASEGDRIKAMDLDGAIKKYEAALEIAPEDTRILWKLGLAFFKKESWADLERTMARAQALAPKNATYALYRGVAAGHQHQWTEARKLLEQAVALDPNVPDAHFELAEAALRLDDEKTALVHYTKAVLLSPRDATLYAALADLYVRLGFDAQGEQTLVAGERAVADEGAKFPLYLLHGRLYEERSDVRGAVAAYESAKKACAACSEPDQRIVFFLLGASYASLQPPRKSEAMAQLAAFMKLVCRSAAAYRYVDQCTRSQEIATKLGGTL